VQERVVVQKGIIASLETSCAKPGPVRRSLQTCGSLVISWSVTPARLLVAESLVFDRCRNDRFVEKFLPMVHQRQWR
jgi:hypothetical protein